MLLIADAFTTGWSIAIVGFLLFLLALGKWHSRRADDIQNKDRFAHWGAQADIEQRDIAQMLEAENELRRRHGRPALTEDDLRAQVEAEQLDRLADARGRRRRHRAAGHARERRGF